MSFFVMVPSKPSMWMVAPQAQATVTMTSVGSASAREVHGDCWIVCAQ